MKKILCMTLAVILLISGMPPAAAMAVDKAECLIKANPKFVDGKMPIDYIIDYYQGTQSMTWFNALVQVECKDGETYFHRILGPKKPISPATKEKGTVYAEIACSSVNVREVILKKFEFETGYVSPPNAVNFSDAAGKKDLDSTGVILALVGVAAVVGITLIVLSVAVPGSN